MISSFRTALQDRIEARDFDVPILNSTALRLLSLCGDGDYDIEEVAGRVRSDQTLAGHVLRVANSIAFGSACEVTSILDAVNRLGARTITDICVTMVVKDKVFKARGPCSGLIQKLWKHAAVSGVFAQKIGQLLRGNHDLAMLCGLLQDIGKPILIRLILELEAGLGIALPPGAMEDLLEPLHADVGGIVVAKWELPLDIGVAAACHHRWEDVDEHGRAALIAFLADLLTRWTLDPDARQGQSLQHLPVVRALGLDPRALGGLFTARGRIQEIAEAFS